MRRYRTGAVLGDEAFGRAECGVDGVALGGAGEIDDRLGEGQLAFRAAQALVGGHGFEGGGEGARIGQADVLHGHAQDAPAQVEGIGAAVQHAAEPVQGRVGTGAAHRLVQGGDLVVEGVAALVEATPGRGQGLADEGGVGAFTSRRAHGGGELFQQVEQAAAVAVGLRQQQFAALFLQDDAQPAEGQGPFQQRRQAGLVEGLQHIDLGAGEEGAHHLEGGVLGGGADEGDEARLDMRQEGVLLAFVEAMHLVDEEDGLPAQPQVDASALDGLADFLDAGQHRRDLDEICGEVMGHEPGQGGLADPGRPPEDHGVRLAGLESQAQRLAGAEQMLLADDLVDTSRTQALGQGYVVRLPVGLRFRRGGSAEQIAAVSARQGCPPPWAG